MAGRREDLLFAQFHAAEVRPTGYPADAPFLPGHAVGVFSPGVGNWVLTWEAIADPAQLVTAVLAKNERDGWELQAAPAAGSLLPVTLYVLYRDERRRVLSVTSIGAGSVLTQLEAPRSGERDTESASELGGPVGYAPKSG